MKEIRFNQDKNKWLIVNRGISFEEIIRLIENAGYIKVIKNPNITKYPRQKLFIIEYKGHIYIVPFVEEKKLYIS